MRVMQVTGIYPYQFDNRGKNMGDHFDYALNEYLERTSKEPYTACACCGRNIFEGDYCFKYDQQLYCDKCITRLDCDFIEPDEWLKEGTL